LFTSESVTSGHPDKISDQISDAVLDEALRQDPDSRVACETFVTTDFVLIGGEVKTKAKLDVEGIVRNVVRDIGYVDDRIGFNYRTCRIMDMLHEQSPDISQGVTEGENKEQKEEKKSREEETDAKVEGKVLESEREFASEIKPEKESPDSLAGVLVRAPCKGVVLQWVQFPPGNCCSSQ